MTLPVIVAPTFELTQPSTQKKLTYRPFLVKEEKILLMARESNDRADMLRAIKQIIANCIQNEDFDVNTLPLYDMEYIFIQLRAKSVDNIVHFNVNDSDDGKQYDLELDLNDVNVIFPDEPHNGIVKINDEFSMKLFHPNASISESLTKMNDTKDVAMQLILNCVECVFDDENVYPWKTSSNKEKEVFIDSLSHAAFEEIQKFFETSPKIEHVVTYKNSLDVEKKVYFRNLDDFFTLY